MGERAILFAESVVPVVAMGFVGVRAYISTKVNRNMYSRVFDMTKHVAQLNGITIDKQLLRHPRELYMFGGYDCLETQDKIDMMCNFIKDPQSEQIPIYKK